MKSLKTGLAMMLALSTACGTAEVKTATFEARGQGVQRADIVLASESGIIGVRANRNPDPLLHADIQFRGEVTFNEGQGTEPAISLVEEYAGVERVKHPNWLEEDCLQWQVEIAPQVPVALHVVAGVGAHLELEGLNLMNLEVENASGHAELRLPVTASTLPAKIVHDSGDMDISIPDDANLKINELQIASGSVIVHVGNNVSLEATMELASGSLEVDIPDNAAVWLEVQDKASGSLDLPNTLVRVRGAGDTGEWKTAGYDAATRTIHIVISDFASGSVTLR